MGRAIYGDSPRSGRGESPSFLDAVRQTVKRYGLIKQKETVIVGVSGGPDSVALLYALYSLRDEFKIKLHVVHVDHMLRKDSALDAFFVESLCRKLLLPVSVVKVNVKALIEYGGSTEEIARNVRLSALFNTAKKKHCHTIALGHNFDDQAETVLMRIIRGAGLYGLSGILPCRDFSGYTIIRPLIGVRRREIESFLRKKKIRARTDQTNRSEEYFRNKVRLSLIPMLERAYNPNIKKVLCNMAEHIGFDYDYLFKTASRNPLALSRSINLEKFARLHPSLRNLIIRMHIERLQHDMRRITFTHIQEINDLILNRPSGSIVDLPRGISVIKKRKILLFFRR